MKKQAIYWISGVVVLAGGIVGIATLSRPKPPKLTKRAPIASPPTLPNRADELKHFVEKNHASPSPAVQDRVGAARLRLAYKSAEKKDWKAARTTLLTAAREYRGEGKQGSDFGGVKDQATYQAAVCLIASGKKAEGRQELVAFMQAEPFSPLVTAAYRRIVRLDGHDDPKLQDLLQKDIAQQEKRIRFETSVCGPKCIERMLPLVGKPLRDYKDIAKLCSTADKGTTCKGLVDGLAALGVPSFPYELSADDFAKIRRPAILIRPSHYVLLEKIEGDKVTIYDPVDGKERQEDMPTDPKLSISAILLDPPAKA